jgi:hypothetical protein
LAIISSNSCAVGALGNTVLFISRLELTQPSQTSMMTQSLESSVSSLMSIRLIIKSFVVTAEVSVFDFCFAVLNSLCGDSSFTCCPLLTFFRITVVCTVKSVFFWYYVCCVVKSDGDCQLIPSVHKVNSLSCCFVFSTGHSLSNYGVIPSMNCKFQGDLQHLPITEASSSIKQFFVLRKFINVFIAKLAVLASVNYSLDTVWKVC